MVSEQDLNVYLSKFDKKYWLTYKVLDILQKVRVNLTRTTQITDWRSSSNVPELLPCAVTDMGSTTWLCNVMMGHLTKGC